MVYKGLKVRLTTAFDILVSKSYDFVLSHCICRAYKVTVQLPLQVTENLFPLLITEVSNNTSCSFYHSEGWA